jgi:ATP-dependent DNA helicase PIF1
LSSWTVELSLLLTAWIFPHSGVSRPLEPGSFTDAAELFLTRNKAGNASQSKMRQLVGELRTFDARDGDSVTEKSLHDKLLANCMASETVTLKKGAQLMLMKNIDENLVAKIIGFMNETQFDSYNDNEETLMEDPL